MAREGRAPPSRAGRRQVACYVAPELLAAVKARAASRRESLQQALAHAVNAELLRRGIGRVVTCELRHMFVRVEKAAKPHPEGHRDRPGRAVVAGWFDRGEIVRLRRVSAEIGVSVQDIAAAGLRSLDWRSPEDGEGTGATGVTEGEVAA